MALPLAHKRKFYMEEAIRSNAGYRNGGLN